MTVTLPWSDSPATSAVHVRARHVNELRNTVDRNRRAANLSAVAWTDNPVSSAAHIRSVHFTEIRAAIPSSVPIGAWSMGNPPSSSRQVSARDMNDLRGWVDQFSQSLGFPPGPDPVPQGITSFTFDPDSTPQSIIDSAWVQDIVTLSGQNSGPLRVRAIVTKGNQNYQAYQSAFQLYANRGLETFAVLDNAFDPQGGSHGLVTDRLTTQGGLSNPYIDDFSSQAEGFAGALLLSGLRNYFVWNEPNNDAATNNDFIPLDRRCNTSISSRRCCTRPTGA